MVNKTQINIRSGAFRAIAFLFLAVCLIHSTLNLSFAAESLYIKVKSTKLRTQPSFLSAAGSTLNYGDLVTKLEGQDGWVKIRVRGQTTGFIHESALTDKKVVLSSASSKGSTPDATDVVLAGKGFSAQIEKEYAAKHRELNFSAVNAAERLSISDKELTDFAAEGRLGKEG